MPPGPASEAKTTVHYCPSCGEEVFTYAVRSDTGLEIRCACCGLPLERRAPQDLPPMECVMLADDEKFIRWILCDLLLDKRLAGSVVPCESGGELLTKFTERLRGHEETQLVILDILMRDLDGVAAAKALRAVERGFAVERPVPILFLSGLRPDTALRRFVASVQPALFLNKAVDVTPDRLAMRLHKMFDYFARGREVPAAAAALTGGGD